MARGGKRIGQVGQAYSNRSDLSKASNAITQTSVEGMTGLPYGQKQSLMQAAQGTPEVGGGGAAPEIGQPSGPPGSDGGPLPGSLGSLDRPTERPNEPVSAGANLGPGPGMEALPGAPAGSPNAMDQGMANQALPMLEMMSTLPGATMGFKNYVRSLLASQPTK